MLACVAGQELYPVPTDVMENRIYPALEADLRQRFGLRDDDYEGLLQALGAHARWCKPRYVGPALEDAPFQPPCSFPAKKATRGIWGSWVGMNTHTDAIERPLAGIESAQDVHAHRWPDPDWFDYGMVAGYATDLDRYYPIAAWAAMEADYARIAGSFDPLFCRITELCGMEQGMVLMAARPDLIHALVGHIGEFLEEYYRRVADAGRGYLDFLAFGDDFAGQGGMLISPRRWREYFLPTWRRLFGVAHAHGMKVLFHSCGSIRPVLGDLIDAGMDAYEVVQHTTAGMDPIELKRDFGADITFYGGVDTQELLPFGTPARVREEVRRMIDIFGRGGRFVLSSMHLLMDDVPAANVVAMYAEASTYVPGRR